MKLVAKTAGWALISGLIFFSTAIYNDCPWYGAAVATFWATLAKTPAYPAWEFMFNRIWSRRQRAAVQ